MLFRGFSGNFPVGPPPLDNFRFCSINTAPLGVGSAGVLGVLWGTLAGVNVSPIFVRILDICTYLYKYSRTAASPGISFFAGCLCCAVAWQVFFFLGLGHIAFVREFSSPSAAASTGCPTDRGRRSPLFGP